MIQAHTLLDSFFHTVDRGNIQQLNLRIGQLVKGQILEIFNGRQALVSIQGTPIVANLEIPVTKGQKSWFVVTSAQDEIKLKIINEDTHTNEQNHASRSPETPREILKQLELKNNEKNLSIVEEMMKHDLPIDKESFDLLAKMVQNKEDMKSITPALKLLSLKGLPMTKTNLHAVQEFVHDEGFIQKLLNLSNEIQTVMSRSNEEINSLSKELQNQLKTLEQSLQGLIKDFQVINPDVQRQDKLTENKMKPEESKFQLEQKTQQEQKLQAEQKILIDQRDPKGTIPERNQGIKGNEHVQESKSSSQINKEIHFTNKINFQEPMKMDSEKFLDKMVQFLEELELKPSQEISQREIASLKEQMEQLYLQKEQLPKSLLPSLERAILHITGQHLLVQEDTSLFTQTVIQFPDFVLHTKEPVFLQIHSKKENGKPINPDDVKLVFLFQLNDLKEVMVQVQIMQKQMFIQLYNDHPAIKTIMKQLEPSLLEFIKEQGYQTTGITVQSMSKEQSKTNITSMPSYKGVDIRI